MSELIKKIEYENEYDYECDLNWRDDETYNDATNRNDFISGYNQDPYQFQQWASKKRLKRINNMEVTKCLK